MKLTLKPTIIPYQLNGQVVLQFNGQYAKIPDPHGAVWHLVKSLDGEQTVPEIIAGNAKHFPGIPTGEIENVLDDLVKYRLVEIPETLQPTSLSDVDRIRFSRNIDFFGSMAAVDENKFAYQEKLRNSKVCVLGCGGLGTHILFDLAALGIHNLTILDFDKIELSNLNRQILYRESDIGETKVETAKKRLLEFNSALNIKSHNMRLESTADVSKIVEGHDLVICIADKPANYMSEWLNEACVQHRIPFITGGLDTRRSVFYSVIPGVTGCVECWLACARAKNPLFNNISTMNKELDITFERPAPAFVTLVAVTAGMMVSEAVKIITQCQPAQLANKLKEFVFDDLSVGIAETWEKRSECHLCSH
ncbi:HesA/MoeB/ThiF family protein [Burkholderia ubonensis]|uniref:HesA/MoeB/ThiF family protein n=1 Tax=Burkholderia ubonensis TaxID=101571 RepID=UPI000F574CB4|nr:ThiF family adenylyltransferase [Burkholderia ubonensis]RQP34184.1 ThiF family adenylyltransferase [Burkholderia ubonensis]RQP40355.1 ThiF family adenylyltransferase [Burkholderia ubonensis]RQP40581.1 ThiF family adenylyltransferase [Burkholderia ubonensis]RQP53975.1 ThiF family adenylyltransferase [Burkholderia ubonensis]RQP57453.1 ThiF family adenylyltransferase [Burkholderia ubonensis]